MSAASNLGVLSEEGLNRGEHHAGELLRARGMRSTPQRRAILSVFRGGPAEHLSADEIYSRAVQALPDLSRGTVYATLAEFTETGLLASFGSPEPVRYESNTAHHAHFRCRLCMRIIDVEAEPPDPAPYTAAKHTVESIELCAEGICSDCGDYERSLRSGVRALRRSTAPGETPGTAATEMKSPLGSLMIAASAEGVTRVAFEEHADFEPLRALAASRRGNRAAMAATRQCAHALGRYFEHQVSQFDIEVDWSALPEPDALRAATEVPFGTTWSYTQLAGDHFSAAALGSAFGSNPVPILIPCHRITRGIEIPDTYVGGPERRAWLLAHEQPDGTG